MGHHFYCNGELTEGHYLVRGLRHSRQPVYHRFRLLFQDKDTRRERLRQHGELQLSVGNLLVFLSRLQLLVPG